jgi:hypothetical protein
VLLDVQVVELLEEQELKLLVEVPAEVE